jgi:magnesium chelatase family protein
VALAIVYSRGRAGIDAPLVTVEVHVANGLPAMNIVGLPEAAVKESKDRVRGALLNSRFDFPAQRITVNLAPAELPKEGGRFDLAIALGILAASGQISIDRLDQYECVGELSLGGELRPVSGVLPVAI